MGKITIGNNIWVGEQKSIPTALSGLTWRNQLLRWMASSWLRTRSCQLHHCSHSSQIIQITRKIRKIHDEKLEIAGAWWSCWPSQSVIQPGQFRASKIGRTVGPLSQKMGRDFEDATSRTLRRLRASMSWQKSPELKRTQNRSTKLFVPLLQLVQLLCDGLRPGMLLSSCKTMWQVSPQKIFDILIAELTRSAWLWVHWSHCQISASMSLKLYRFNVI